MNIILKEENIKLVRDSANSLRKTKFIPSSQHTLKDLNLNKKFQIITNFDDAFYNYFLHDDYIYNGDPYYSWSDLKEEILPIIPINISNRISKEFGGCFIDLDINNKMVSNFSSDIGGDLKQCLLARGIMGKGNSFFEDILEAYLLGGWPCGWEGIYPNGKLIVYFNTYDDYKPEE